jgi:hypothetical protein
MDPTETTSFPSDKHSFKNLHLSPTSSLRSQIDESHEIKVMRWRRQNTSFLSRKVIEGRGQNTFFELTVFYNFYNLFIIKFLIIFNIMIR